MSRLKICIDALTPADDHTNKDDTFPSPFSQHNSNKPYVVTAKISSVGPAAALIQENSRGKLDLQTSSASFLVTMAGVVHPMKAVRFFSAWFQLRVILQQYLSNDSLHWCLQVHWDFSIFLSEGQQQNVVNSLPNIFVHESYMFQ